MNDKGPEPLWCIIMFPTVFLFFSGGPLTTLQGCNVDDGERAAWIREQATYHVLIQVFLRKFAWISTI